MFFFVNMWAFSIQLLLIYYCYYLYLDKSFYKNQRAPEKSGCSQHQWVGHKFSEHRKLSFWLYDGLRTPSKDKHTHISTTILITVKDSLDIHHTQHKHDSRKFLLMRCQKSVFFVKFTLIPFQMMIFSWAFIQGKILTYRATHWVWKYQLVKYASIRWIQ